MSEHSGIERREIIRRADRLTAGERGAVTPSTGSLHAMVGEIDSQLALLKTACPVRSEMATNSYRL